MTELIRLKCGMVNCWLLRGEDGGVLVDTGVIRYRELLYERLRDANVRLIFHTHGHVDHIGNTAWLAERLQAPVAMHEADWELVTKPHARKLHAHSALGKFIQTGTDRSMYKAPPFAPALSFLGGEKLGDYGVDAQVAALPGHTAGSVGLLVNGTDLIAGDAMFNIFAPTPGLIYEDRGQLMESVERIRLTGCTVIHPGHGKPFSAQAYFNSRKPNKPT